MIQDPLVMQVFAAVFGALAIATVIARIIALKTKDKENQTVRNLIERINSWWLMVAVLAVATTMGIHGACLLFLFVSYHALREYIALTPTVEADRWALFWSFYVILPVNYLLISMSWYGFFSIFIPVYAYVWIPIREAIAGDTKDFLTRTAKIQWGLMICVYFISYVPALMSLKFKGFGDPGNRLLLFLVIVCELSDVLQYVFGKLMGKTKIAPEVSPNKTVEGFVGGVLSSAAVGACLWWLTPFLPWQAALMSMIICLMGFCGGLVMSAIKRDIGVKDYGTMIPGHGGMMDRMDSLCFAAPVFFHATRYFFGGG